MKTWFVTFLDDDLQLVSFVDANTIEDAWEVANNTWTDVIAVAPCPEPEPEY